MRDMSDFLKKISFSFELLKQDSEASTERLIQLRLDHGRISERI